MIFNSNVNKATLIWYVCSIDYCPIVVQSTWCDNQNSLDLIWRYTRFLVFETKENIISYLHLMLSQLYMIIGVCPKLIQTSNPLEWTDQIIEVRWNKVKTPFHKHMSQTFSACSVNTITTFTDCLQFNQLI